MASVIRVNTINSRSGLSTVTFDNSGAGVEVAGIVTATSFGAVSGTTGTFSGDLSVAENIVHTGDTDTKIVFTNNQIDFHANSSSRLYINQYAAYVQTGYPLAFLSSSGPTPNIKSGGTNNQNLLFTTGSGNPTRLSINPAGISTFYGDITLEAAGANRISMRHTSGGNAVIKNPTAASLSFGTNNQDNELTIANGGKVGINTTIPSDLLTIVHSANTDDGISIVNTNNSQASAIAQLELSAGDNSHARVQFECNGKYSTIRHDGNGVLDFYTNGSNKRLTIDADGRVLIGQSSSTSSSKLCVHGAHGTPEAFFELNRTDDPANGQNVGVIEFSQGSAASRLAARIMTRRDGGVWGAASLPTRFEFHTCVSGSNSATEKVRITSSGQLQINHGNAAKMSFYHDAANSLNHITSNNGNEIKVSSGNGAANGIEFWDYSGVHKRCQIDGHGIKFGTDTDEDNALNDYEEGSWTPTYGGTHSGISGNHRHARYTKIGNIVFYSLEYYNSSNAGSWSSGFEIGGMPHASSLSELYCSPSIGVMYGPGGYAMNEDASGRIYHLGSQNKIYFKFGTSGVRHLWIQFFHRVEN